MSRLFLGNFDFEHRLADPRFVPSAKLTRLNAELASTWLTMADDGDWVWTPFAFDPEFFPDAIIEGLPRVTPVISLKDVPHGVECVPWGWSHEVRALVDRFHWIANAPPENAVRQANSRATSFELERTWNVGLPDSRCVRSLDDFHDSVRRLRSVDARWVVKSEFGMSARERILGQGAPTLADDNWVRRRLHAHGAVFFEPWVDRISEVGIQIEIPELGTPTLMGLTPMEVDARGQYAGSWFAFEESRFQRETALWPEAIEMAIRAARHLQTLGYFGPLGIDAMVYRDADGSTRIRPLQDMNARMTMGRMSLGLRRYRKPDEEGFWQHGSKFDPVDHLPLNATRIIATSTNFVGSTPSQHVSRIVFCKVQ